VTKSLLTRINIFNRFQPFIIEQGSKEGLGVRRLWKDNSAFDAGMHPKSRLSGNEDITTLNTVASCEPTWAQLKSALDWLSPFLSSY
jgi:hypothetical protein